jgi:Carboxypeptidase regulatory-like domain/TonB dependent receptor
MLWTVNLHLLATRVLCADRFTFLVRTFALSLLLLLELGAAAQTANLSGAVSDSSHAVVIAASVTIVKESTGLKHTTTSSDQGFYHFAFLPPGSYTISVRANGFAVVNLTGVKLDPGQEARLDFTLSPAAVKESITVRGNSSSVQTESPALGTEVDSQLIQELPLNGRTFQSLIALAPGVVMPGTLSQVRGQGGIIVNGQRSTANYFTVDGVSANLNMQCVNLQCNPRLVGADAGGTSPVYTLLGTTHNLVSLDGMQEFKLQTSTTPAEFGRAGGGQLQIVTRSGSNDFHGSLFDYFRNEALDANDWFANSAGFPRAPHRQNDFGGIFGGPILKNRTFFFFSYEGLRLLVPGVGKIFVPSLSVRQAATGAIKQLFDAFPLPNGPEDPATMFAQFTGNFPSLTSSDNASIRIDQMVSQKLILFGRYSEAPSTGSQQGYDVVSSRASFRSITFGATLALSSKTTSDLRLNYSRNDADRSFRLVSFGGSDPPPDSLLFPPPFASPGSSLTFISLPIGYRAGRGGENLQRQGNLVSNTSILEGSHELKFGVDYRYLAPHIGPFNYRLHPGFDSLQSALSGITSETTIQSFDSVTMGFQDLSLYGEDNWKVTPRFTLIYGLRWELNPAPYAKDHQQLITLTGFPVLASMQLAPLGTPVYDTTYNNFAPRFGAAYQLLRHPDRETVVRGGFGIFYDLGVGNIGNAAAAFPHLREKDLFGVPFPLSTQNAMPPPPVSLDPPYSDVFEVFAPQHKLPRSYQWNLTVDQSLGARQVLSASYVGETGRRLLRENILYDPNPRFSDSQINLTTNGSSSDYHALQVQFQRRIAGGLAALLSYTWSHSLDDTSADEGGDNFTNPRLDRGPSDFDARHAFNAAFAYNIPGPGGNPALRRVLSNWSIDTIFTTRTALPDNVFVVREDLGLDTRLFNARPDRVPGAPLYIYDPALPGGRRISPAAFTVPVEVRQGDLGRNALRGFPVSQLDFAIRRQFSVTDKVKLQWRVEFFNLLNHPNFGMVDSNFGFFPPLQPNQDFGIAVGMLNGSTDDPLYSVGGPRSIQLSLQLRF